MIDMQMPEKRDFKYSDIHKMVGQIIFMEPSDSDINEGNFMAQVWFVAYGKGKEKFKGLPTWYLLSEWDTRKQNEEKSV